MIMPTINNHQIGGGKEKKKKKKRKEKEKHTEKKEKKNAKEITITNSLHLNDRCQSIEEYHLCAKVYLYITLAFAHMLK